MTMVMVKGDGPFRRCLFVERLAVVELCHVRLLLGAEDAQRLRRARGLDAARAEQLLSARRKRGVARRLHVELLAHLVHLLHRRRVLDLKRTVNTS